MPRDTESLNLRVTSQLKRLVEDYAEEVGITTNAAGIMLLLAGLNKPEGPSPAVRPPRRRGTRLPEDFAVTPEMVAWARENAPDVDGRIETAQFCDYWWAKSGQTATKLDWVRTWQTWMRKHQQEAGWQVNGRRRVSASSVVAAEIDQAFEEVFDEKFGSKNRPELPGGSRP